MEETVETTEAYINDLVLPEGWKITVTEKDRLVYINEDDKIWSWLPPIETWRSRHGLSYGWEIGQCSNSQRYYINHLKKETFRSLPVEPEQSADAVIAPRTRTVVILRHSDIGYGFVAGSEKPVLIRSVAEDGPSAGKLYANDQILKINDEDVRNMPQSEVIQRIKESTQELNLEVIASDDVQDVRNRGQRKSSIMSRSTREKRRSNPVSVRFAEAPVLIQYVGSPPGSPLRRSSLPLIPNVLKIYLENGQTRSFLYNSTTVIKDMFLSLTDKIGLKRIDRFALVLQATQSLSDYVVQANERVSQIYTRRNCSSSAWLTKLLMIFPPKDVHTLLKEDPVAFDYFYRQMCSQVVEGRFGWELKYDTAIKLAALHLQQYALEEKIGKGGKISVKAIEREVGSLENFVPSALINTMQKKDLQRILTQQIKQTRNLCPPGQKYISSVQAKLQYLKICSEMKTYGGKQFNAVVVDSASEDGKFFQEQKFSSLIFVGPNVGLAQVTNPRTFLMLPVAEFSQINGLVITPHTEGKQNVKLFLNNGKSITLIMGPICETRDLAYLISGYHKHLVENAKPLSIIDMTSSADVDEPSNEVPSYYDSHRVMPDDCTYQRNGNEKDKVVREIDFNRRPDFENSGSYSLADHSKNSRAPNTHVSNGSVKTHLSIQLNNSRSLNSIKEELSPTSPKENNTVLLLSSQKGIYMNGGHEPKRRSFVDLGEDLMSESTDEERNDNSKTESLVKQKDTENDSHVSTTSPTKSPVRNHASIHVSSPSLPNTRVEQIDNPEALDDGGAMTIPVHEVHVDIPLTPSMQSCESYTSDDISSLSSGSGIESSRSSPVHISSAILLKNPSTKQVVVDNDDSTSVADASVDNSFEDNSNKEELSFQSETNNTMMDAGQSEEVKTNGTDVCDGNRLEMVTNTDSKENSHASNNSPSEVKMNGDIRSSSFKQKRRISSGYLPYNGVARPGINALQCIIKDDITLTVDQATEDEETGGGQITSRADACDHTLKTFYSLKTQLNTLKLSTNAVRTNNEILRNKKQSMIEKINALLECSKSVKDLETANESDVIEAIVKTRSCLSDLTESCTQVYNAQYSMKHLTSELIECIEKHIDLLITTDAWDPARRSDITMEVHKDKCDLVHESLESLRKIVNNLL